MHTWSLLAVGVFVVMWLTPAAETRQANLAEATGGKLDGVETFVAGLLDEWRVPGLALGVVAGGEVHRLRGFGLRDTEAGEPVTPRTLFAIGSSTKSFTATAVAMLVDEGRLAWDDPVRRHLPDFRLHDPVATEQITPVDLLTHRSGLPGYNSLWYSAPFSRADLFERLRHLPPSRPLRASFQYQSLMYLSAGVLVERLSGSSWEAFVRSRIFEPLGMTRSTFAPAVEESTGDVARPYHRFEPTGQPARVPFKRQEAIGPAGSIVSNAEDLVRYVQFQLALGRVGDRQLLATPTARRMQFPQTIVPIVPPDKELGHVGYGLGFFVSSYRGRTHVYHGGNIDGFNALVAFLPGEGIGVVVLTNISESPVPELVSRWVFDRLLGLDPIDWAGRARLREAEARKRQATAANEPAAGPRPGTRPSHALHELAGRYEHPAYGTAIVELDGDTLHLTLHGLTYALRHYHYDVFELAGMPGQLEPFGGTKVTFLYNRQGEVDRLAMPLEPAVDDLVFRRGRDR